VIPSSPDRDPDRLLLLLLLLFLLLLLLLPPPNPISIHAWNCRPSFWVDRTCDLRQYGKKSWYESTSCMIRYRCNGWTPLKIYPSISNCRRVRIIIVPVVVVVFVSVSVSVVEVAVAVDAVVVDDDADDVEAPVSSSIVAVLLSATPFVGCFRRFSLAVVVLVVLQLLMVLAVVVCCCCCCCSSSSSGSNTRRYCWVR